MDVTTTGTMTPSGEAEESPLKKLTIHKRTRLRAFGGCSPIKDYELLEKLGEGTFGEVHKARHRKTKALVALKRILMHNEKDGFPITALREIKILKTLSHKNVILLADMAVERGDKAKKRRGSIYMVTPYMDHDLSGLLDNPAVTFSTPQVKCYMLQLLAGLAYLHKRRILHRDMKAANLLIDNRGVLQIADFGLARFCDESACCRGGLAAAAVPGANDVAARREMTNCVVTRWYRPPELLLGERRYTTSVDLWGVGCVMAEMIRGRPLLQGSSDLDQLDRIFRLCGTPTDATMPGFTSLPGCEGTKGTVFRRYPRTFDREFAGQDMQTRDLLSRLLELDPGKRLTAVEAQSHPYFSTAPLPADPSALAQYESSHEIDRRKKKPRAAADVDAVPVAPAAPAGVGLVEGDGQVRDAGMPPINSGLPPSAPPSVSSARTERRELLAPPHRERDRNRDLRDDLRDRDSNRDRDGARERDALRERDWDRLKGREREREREPERVRERVIDRGIERERGVDRGLQREPLARAEYHGRPAWDRDRDRDRDRERHRERERERERDRDHHRDIDRERRR